MVFIDTAGLAITSADAVVRIICAWKRRRSAHEQVCLLLEDAQKRVLRIQAIAWRFITEVVQSSRLSRDVFQRIAEDFEAIKLELEVLESKLKSKSNFKKWLASESSVATLSSILSRLNPLENHLELVGMMIYTQGDTCDRIAEIANRIDSMALYRGMGFREEPQGEPSQDFATTLTSRSANTLLFYGNTDKNPRPLVESRGLPEEIVADRWRLDEKIGSGSFSEVFIATDVQTGQHVAIKFERDDIEYPQLYYEDKIYRWLNMDDTEPIVGVPRRFYFGAHLDYSMLVIDLLGPSLEHRLNQCYRSMSLKSVLMIGLQALRRVEYVHEKGFIHRDLKPGNLLMGRGDEARILFVVDYGLGKRYCHPVTKQHIPFREGKHMIGTTRFASINAHRGFQQSRRDDLESLGYVLVYLAKGALPWQGLMVADKEEKYEVIREMKEKMIVYDLCRDMPRQFVEYFRYVRGLGFEERPDYSHLRGLFRKAMERRGLIDDGVFDWMESAAVPDSSTTVVAQRL